MHTRLRQVIDYKTGGKKKVFAELMGWSPQYLGKLLHGDDFGLKPVMAILSAVTEVNARWFLFGEGEMLENGKMSEIRREAVSRAQELLDLDKYVPYMSPEELHQLEEALATGKKPVFSPETLPKWQERLNARESEINAKFAEANRKSEEPCRRRTARK